ncbi:magnesium/cobalt transporter CorA [Streptomyces sp. NBC_00264]|uniref:magnesium/cobalt transporter CorA n=1 Tax=unclassified Streptomyces TaxID=2593676 RepID=UPI000F5BC31F|nr:MULTISPECIES: magnesium/cobalt transporter CorA [unclassified Streptomyces]WSG49860.1 magnesium/cobalt transporter CorA [Streptomyces sp. NBC_01732]WSX00513.1 magnesium/cobalt transporter CorA [Streptomyces sp. NBC_00987]MCX5099619.1 magnesium/cobalt transporter CorA [Streptomyces sp. NBC_00439]MCX5159165.1 magnesium/cobalt transporter CorA [Streptomyces sp. NBC_00305]MCX5217688.1 magnesium/cobalt transporter CorA [Streptomyces sp. NBC_00264]
MRAVIVDCAIYRDGRRTDGPADFSDALDEARATGDAFLWIGLHEPTEKEFDLVSSEFGLHPLAVEDALSAHQRPKLEVYDDSLFAVIKPVVYEQSSDTVTTDELMAFIGDSFVVTVRHGEGAPLAAVRRRLEAEPEVLKHGPTAVLYAISDAVVDHYIEVAGELQVDLEELETEVFAPTGVGDTKSTAARIYTFKRQILEFRRAAGPLSAPMARLASGGVPFVHEHSQPFFRDVSDHLTRANEYVEGLDRLLSDILSAHLAQVGVRQNDDMRKISAWAAMAAVPTMVAGIYGMNFDHMPELRWVWAYPAVIALMAAVVFALYRQFKRRGWL